MKTLDEVKKLLEEISYITIASVTSEGLPWNSPCFAVHDETYNFYWTSSPDSQHSLNIKEKSEIFIVVYNSTALAGEGWGVYMEAKAEELGDGEELQHAIQIFYAKKITEPKPTQYFLNEAPRRMYKATPTQVWVNDYDKNRIPADLKIEIKLK